MADKITMTNGVLTVPDEPIIPFVEGDGTGVDIWPAAQLVMDAAAAKHGKTIAWKEVLAGRRRSTPPAPGSLTKRSRRSARTSSVSRARSPHRSAAVSAR